jgi:hypothetical protein
MICGNFFITGDFFREQVRCEFPRCGCDYPNLQCRRFEYHPLSLRVGLSEVQDIANQRRLRRNPILP